jgi:hypothetical protein
MRSSGNSTINNGISEWHLITKLVVILAIVTGILYLRVFMVEIVPAIFATGQRAASVLSLALLLCAILSLVSTRYWEGWGGVIAMLSGLGLGSLIYLTAEEKSWLNAFFYSSPFIIAGALSLADWWRSQKGVLSKHAA